MNYICIILHKNKLSELANTNLTAFIACNNKLTPKMTQINQLSMYLANLAPVSFLRDFMTCV